MNPALPSPRVLAVVLNWRRPMNIPPILDALNEQTVKLTTVLVECSYGTEYVCHAWRKFDDCVRLGTRNLGPCSRFVPALAYTGFDYVFFAVDDFVPGPRCVESMVAVARAERNEFATIGQDGRLVHPDYDELIKARVRQSDPDRDKALVRVDVSTTSELVRADLIHHAIEFRDRLAKNHAAISLFEDDMILCMGLQMATGFPSILTPQGPEEESWRVRRLKDNDALSARESHKAGRDFFVKCARELGWRSLVRRAG